MEAYLIGGDIEIVGPCIKVHQHVRHERHTYWWQPANNDMMLEVKCAGYYRDT